MLEDQLGLCKGWLLSGAWQVRPFQSESFKQAVQINHSIQRIPNVISKLDLLIMLLAASLRIRQ